MASSQSHLYTCAHTCTHTHTCMHACLEQQKELRRHLGFASGSAPEPWTSASSSVRGWLDQCLLRPCPALSELPGQVPWLISLFFPKPPLCKGPARFSWNCSDSLRAWPAHIWGGVRGSTHSGSGARAVFMLPQLYQTGSHRTASSMWPEHTVAPQRPFLSLPPPSLAHLDTRPPSEDRSLHLSQHWRSHVIVF